MFSHIIFHSSNVSILWRKKKLDLQFLIIIIIIIIFKLYSKSIWFLIKVTYFTRLHQNGLTLTKTAIQKTFFYTQKIKKSWLKAKALRKTSSYSLFQPFCASQICLRYFKVMSQICFSSEMQFITNFTRIKCQNNFLPKNA